MNFFAEMKGVWFGLFILSFASMATSDCCDDTIIWYSVNEGYKCEDAGGIGKSTASDKMDVMGIYKKLDSRKPACITEVCNDALEHKGWYCGVGSCNIFSCNCDGGCWGGKNGDPLANFMKRYPNVIRKASVHSALATIF